jgi:hypothetical protein
MTWFLEDTARRVYAGGNHRLANVPNGEVSEICRVRFAAPDVPEPVKLVLRVRVTGGEYDIENDCSYWVFPARKAPDIRARVDSEIAAKYSDRYPGMKTDDSEETSLRVLAVLDRDAVDYIAGGGSVILLGTGPFPVLRTTYDQHWSLMYGNKAIVIHDHPLTLDFPHEGWGDWQFYSMCDGAQSVVLNEAGLPFTPIIEIVGPYPPLRQESSLFELKIGAGKLLVCTMKLDLNDPASEWMLDNILSYASSSRFQPKTSANASVFHWLLDAGIEAFQIDDPMGDAFDPTVQEQ